MTVRDNRTMPSQPVPRRERPQHPLTAQLIDEMRERGFVTAAEAAARSGIPLPTIYGWAREGLLTCQVSGKRRLFIALESVERVRSRAATPAPGDPGPDGAFRQPVRAGTRPRSPTEDPPSLEDMHARGLLPPTPAAL